MNEPHTASALFLGLVQGLTEFLPISSSGHLAAIQLLWPKLSFPGVTLEVATHLGTTIAVLLYYRHLVAGLVRSEHQPEALLGVARTRWIVLLALGTLPTAIIGFAARSSIRAAFGNLHWIAAGLALSGCVLALTRYPTDQQGRSLGLVDALIIGTVQGIAVFPGVTRSGLTITAALLRGAPRRQAVTYSLLLSVPAILGASVLDAAQALAESVHGTLLFSDLLFATLAAGIIGYFCIGLVHRATRSRQWHRFAWYCWMLALGLVVAAR